MTTICLDSFNGLTNYSLKKNLNLSLLPFIRIYFLTMYSYSQNISGQRLVEHVEKLPTTSSEEKAAEQQAQRGDNELMEIHRYHFSHVSSS